MRKKQMSSRVCNLKRRKEKCAVASSDLNLKVKSSDKSSAKKMDVKKTKMEDSKTEIAQNDCMVAGCRESTTTSERLICKGYKWDEKTRCGAPPDMDELWEGKENGLRFELSRTNVLPENMEGDETEEGVVIDKSIFLDDDSNQVLPVEKFFGNMEVVQDCPQRSAASLTFSRRELRRRQYYAKEDSDEEEGTDMQQEDIGGT
uniref:C1orf174 n=1 Tax=Salmo salar TaxID=8030 RepID=B9EM40_SALSA|nr:C1orf174 [Salmo salar]